MPPKRSLTIATGTLGGMRGFLARTIPRTNPYRAIALTQLDDLIETMNDIVKGTK